MGGSLRRMKPADLIRMAAKLPKIAQRFVELRARFPYASIEQMVAGYPPVLIMAEDALHTAAERVKQAFPAASQQEVGAMLSMNPTLLDGTSLERCLVSVAHLLTRPQLMRSLQTDPTFLYQASHHGYRGFGAPGIVLCKDSCVAGIGVEGVCWSCCDAVPTAGKPVSRRARRRIPG
jgi:hypothetical protein